MFETTRRFDGVAIFLHWTIAVLVILAVGVALTAVSIQDVDQHDPRIAPLVTIHRSVGVTILILAAFNVFWRLTHRAPLLPASIPPAQRGAARVGHMLTYAILLIMPLSGLIDAAAFNQPVDYFFLFKLPLAIAPAKAVGDAAFALHLYLRYLLYVLIGVHTAAALVHHYWTKNDVLRRMLPR